MEEAGELGGRVERNEGEMIELNDKWREARNIESSHTLGARERGRMEHWKGGKVRKTGRRGEGRRGGGGAYRNQKANALCWLQVKRG